MDAMTMGTVGIAPPLAIWVLMMAAMMLPSLAPALWRYRVAFARSRASGATSLTALVAAGYLLAWTALSIAIYPLGAPLAALARAAPIAAGAVVLAAGAVQLTQWKARHLECFHRESDDDCTTRCNAGAALVSGIRMGLRCCCCCAGFTAILLVTGDMSLKAMAIATAAITAERVAPRGARVARFTGAVVICAGIFLIARAT